MGFSFGGYGFPRAGNASRRPASLRRAKWVRLPFPATAQTPRARGTPRPTHLQPRPPSPLPRATPRRPPRTPQVCPRATTAPPNDVPSTKPFSRTGHRGRPHTFSISPAITAQTLRARETDRTPQTSRARGTPRPSAYLLHVTRNHRANPSRAGDTEANSASNTTTQPTARGRHQGVRRGRRRCVPALPPRHQTTSLRLKPFSRRGHRGRPHTFSISPAITARTLRARGKPRPTQLRTRPPSPQPEGDTKASAPDAVGVSPRYHRVANSHLSPSAHKSLDPHSASSAPCALQPSPHPRSHQPIQDARFLPWEFAPAPCLPSKALPPVPVGIFSIRCSPRPEPTPSLNIDPARTHHHHRWAARLPLSAPGRCEFSSEVDRLDADLWAMATQQFRKSIASYLETRAAVRFPLHRE